MTAVADPLGEMRTKLTRRFRWFTVYHAILVAVAIAAIGWMALTFPSSNTLWAFVFIVIVMPAGVPLVWWLNRRGVARVMDAFESFRPRLGAAKVSLSAGYLLVLDNGIVFGADPRTNNIRFIAFFSAGGALLHPDIHQAERWAARIRGMQMGGAISRRKGPSEAQAELERFGAAFGAKAYFLSLRQVRTERMVAGEPMWHEVLLFFIPRWPDHASQIAGQLDQIVSFLETARGRYFPGSGSTA